MNIQDLMEKGGFVDPTPVKAEVVWLKKNKATGEIEEIKFDVHVKRQSWGSMEQLWSGDTEQSKTAKMISSAIVLGADQKESFTYEQAYSLDPDLATALLKAINQTNGKTKEAAKN